MNILLVGLGSIGQRHARNLRTLLGDRAEIGAVRQRGRAQALTEDLQVVAGADVQTQYGIRAWNDLEAALADHPDVVFITNPTSQHLPVALAAARQGCHLFIEKPLSDRMDGVDELLELIARQALVAGVGYQWRFHPGVRRLAAALEQGRLGPLTSVRMEAGEYLPGWHPYEDYRRSYAARRELGGGVILTQIHEIDLIHHLLGLPRRITATGGHLSRLEIDVEDTADIRMDCVVEQRTVPVALHLDYVQQPPVRRYEFIGEKGRAVADLLEPSLRLFDAAGQVVDHWSDPSYERNQMFLDEIEHFLSCVERGAAPAVGVAEAAQSLRMALAARESLETGRVIELAADAAVRESA